MLIVDAVASAGGMPVKMDAWGADVVVSASQKALAVPPGLAFAACSERAMERCVTLAGRGMYLDLARYDEFWRKGETLGTPALSVLFALDAQLEIIEAEGLERRYMRHIAMRSAVTKWVAAAHARHLPVSFLAAAEHRAPTVSCVRYEGDCADLLERLRLRGYVIGSGYGDLARETIRIGHMGDHTIAETDSLLGAMDESIIEGIGVTK